MSMSRLSLFMNRSSRILRDNTSKVLRMSGTEDPSRTPITLLTMNSTEDLQQLATGCDADIGGTSTVNIALNEKPTRQETLAKLVGEEYKPPSTTKFWGEMRLGVRPGYEGHIRGGYAGFRSKPRPTLFGEMTEDVSNHEFIALRLRAGGSPRTRNSYYVNIQTDGPVTTDLWQHRLFLTRDDGGWEDVFIPFNRFVLTNSGEIADQQIEMYRERIRTIGISLLGGNSGVEGPYELEIDSVRAVNEEDVPLKPSQDLLEGTRWQRPSV